MTIQQLSTYFEEKIPATLRCEWDNDGEMVIPNKDAEAKRILVALDATDSVIQCAADGKFDLILTHHPLYFETITPIDEKRIDELNKHGIAVLSYHTRLDAVLGGVNDCLAELLGLKNTAPFGEDGMGRVGELPAEMTFDDFVAFLKAKLGIKRLVALKESERIRRVALLGGSGKELIPSAIAIGADAYVTGEASYNALLCGVGQGTSLFCVGHYASEQPVCRHLQALAQQAYPEAFVSILPSNPLLEA